MSHIYEKLHLSTLNYQFFDSGPQITKNAIKIIFVEIFP